MLTTIFNAFLVIFAFGFVIFWHELGHFLAARWAKVRVEQFAVGMGQALVSFRRGFGMTVGSSRAEYDRRTHEWLKTSGQMPAAGGEWSEWQREQAANALNIGVTEYRLSWIPLGGYVKPTGQDDLRPAAQVSADDPHSFGAAPVGKRMVIISAGVIMNVILAFALYVGLFLLIGFNAPPTVIGKVVPGSPAQAAGLQAGDRIVSIEGKPQQDYTKITMNVALLRAGDSAEVVVDRPGEGLKTLHVTPRKSLATQNLPAMGILPAATFNGPKKSADEIDFISYDLTALAGGGRIVKVEDTDVSNEKDSRILEQAVQKSNGRPVWVTIRKPDGSETKLGTSPSLWPRSFDDAPLSIAGMFPRTRIGGVQRGSPAEKAGFKDGDIIQQMAFVGTGDSQRNPTTTQFRELTGKAAEASRKLIFTRERDACAMDPVEIDPNFALEKGRGIGVAVEDDLGLAVIGDVAKDSPAARAGLAKGDQVVEVAGKPVGVWPDVIEALEAAGTGEIAVAVKPASGEPVKSVKLTLQAEDATALTQLSFMHALPLDSLTEMRKTPNPLTAAAWGVEETKYSIFQVYATLRRVFEGSVPLSSLSGPLGIFNAGNQAATRGTDWLIWFTALISANLAVVNFLPIPIVDGGLFVFLLLEKLTGRPPSPKVQTAAQIVGLALLGSLFLFVTYHDILRTWG